MCREPLSIPESNKDKHALIGEECHIISKANQGPRYSKINDFDYDGYDNLILLCCNHHSQIDIQCETYTIELLKKIKENHEKWVNKKLQKKKCEPVNIKRIKENIPKSLELIYDGKSLFSLMNNSLSHDFDYDEIKNDNEKELIINFADLISELIDTSDMYTGGSAIQIYQILDEKITELHSNHLLVFGAIEIMYLSGGINPVDSPWKTVHIKVVHAESEEIKAKK